MTRGNTTTATTPGATRGWVSFVGSGPGDPGLLTVRAVDLLRRADVVVTEAPEHPALLTTSTALTFERAVPLGLLPAADGRTLVDALRLYRRLQAVLRLSIVRDRSPRRDVAGRAPRARSGKRPIAGRLASPRSTQAVLPVSS